MQKKVEKMLNENKENLDRIVDKLLEEETLTNEQIDEILKSVKEGKEKKEK